MSRQARAERRAERRAKRRRDAALDEIGRLYDRGSISTLEYVDRSEAVRTGRSPRPPVSPPEFLRCPVCHGAIPDGHGDNCFMRPDVTISAPRGGIEYLRPTGRATIRPWSSREATPLYDELAAERGIDPCREAKQRRDDETFRRLHEELTRSFSVPRPMIVLPPDPPKLEDPVVEHARELYRLGHFGDVGTLTARRALARMISGRALDDVRPRTRTGWGAPIERTDP